MAIKIVVLVEGESEPAQVGGNWLTLGDAAGDIDGGDFWHDVLYRYPNGCNIIEIRLVPDKPIRRK